MRLLFRCDQFRIWLYWGRPWYWIIESGNKRAHLGPFSFYWRNWRKRT